MNDAITPGIDFDEFRHYYKERNRMKPQKPLDVIVWKPTKKFWEWFNCPK